MQTKKDRSLELIVIIGGTIAAGLIFWAWILPILEG